MLYCLVGEGDATVQEAAVVRATLAQTTLKTLTNLINSQALSPLPTLKQAQAKN